MSDAPLQDYLTVAQVADLKRVSVTAVYQALKEERLSGKKILGHWAVRREAAEGWEPHGFKDRRSGGRGRKKGAQLSEETCQRMSESAKRSWQRRKGKTA